MPVYPDRVASEARAPPPSAGGNTCLDARALLRGTRPNAAPQQRRDDILPLFRNAFSNVPAYFVNLRSPQDRLEIEVSLGVLVEQQYNSRVRKSDWFAVRDMCQSAANCVLAEETTHIDYWFDNVDDMMRRYNALIAPVIATAHNNRRGSLRVTTDASGTVLACQVKTPCLVQNIDGTNAGYAAYDARIHINYEQNVPALLCQLAQVPAGWTHRRVKTRYRYRTQTAGEWAIDLTLVGDQDSDDPLYEVEFEMMLSLDTIPRCSMADARTHMEKLGEYAWLSLVSHANAIRGRCREIGTAPVVDLFGDWAHAEDSVAQAAHATFSRGMGYQGGTQRAFVGAMPVELTRDRWLNAVLPRRRSVWVAEKTDGVRMALVFDRDHGVCTLDRNGTCYKLATFAPEMNMALMNVLPTRLGPTALDAELVVNQSPTALDRYVLVVFDLVVDCGTPQNAAPFAQRQERMRQLVADHLAPALQLLARDKRLFGMRAKRFVPLDDLDRVWARLDATKPGSSPPERMMRYDAHHQFVADGLVMVDVTEVRRASYYKWKPAWKNTVDFFGEPTPGTLGTVSLWVTNGDGDRLLQVSNAQLSRVQLDELARIYVDNELMARHTPKLDPISRQRQRPSRPLFECRYDADTRRWVLVNFRTDKRTPNHISVLIDALQSLINPLTLLELRQSLL